MKLCSTLCCTLCCTLLSTIPAAAQGIADLSFAPVATSAAVGDIVEIALVATAHDDVPTNIGALDTVLSWDPAFLELLGHDDSSAGYAWFVTGFLPDPDGINIDLADGDAIFTALAQIALPAVAPQAPGLVVTHLRFRALAPTPAATVAFLPTLGTFGRTQVIDFFTPGLDITGDISSVASIAIGGGVPYCEGTAASCPCGNGGGTDEGCATSTGAGASITAGGSTSLVADDLVLTVAGVPVNQFGIAYAGENQVAVPFGDGLRCIGSGPNGLVRFPVTSSGPAGQLVSGPGLIAGLGGGSPFAAGASWNFQGWFRDPTGPCGTAFNLSNAITLVFRP